MMNAVEESELPINTVRFFMPIVMELSKAVLT